VDETDHFILVKCADEVLRIFLRGLEALFYFVKFFAVMSERFALPYGCFVVDLFVTSN